MAAVNQQAPVNSTLVDELGLDFADSGSEHDSGAEDEVDEDHREDAPAAETNEEAEEQDVKQKKKPLNDHRFDELEGLLKRIEDAQQSQAVQNSSANGAGVDEQFDLISQSNEFSTIIDDYKSELHKRLKDLYSTRFPELETLLPDALEYAKTVAVLGNGPMTQDNLRDLASSSANALNAPLTSVLSRPKLMTVTVEASTSKGRELSADALDSLQSSCARMLRLESAKKTITEFVESRMALFCPNLSTLVGSETAAELLTARGGLAGLAQTRAANLPGVGSKRFAASGLATNTGIRNQGIVYNCDLVRYLRPDYKVQAMRIVSSKIVLAARVDLSRTDPQGVQGAQMLEQAQGRIEKLQESAPNKGIKALPVPDDKPSKKRGGRRARKAKEATAMTDLRKAQNRMKFGEEERETGYGTGESTAGMGMIGQQDDGRIRGMQVDQRTRAKLSKKNQGWNVGGGGGTNTQIGPGSGAASSLRAGPGTSGTASVLKGHGLRTSGVATSLGSATAGTASSLAFNQRQGLELVDPKAKAEMERRQRADADKYFKGGTFTQVGGGAGDGFKKPALPAKRKAEDGG
ncbi:MAG: hypothetical protein Q9162_003705 [Coniocarpon cinnabarinum]